MKSILTLILTILLLVSHTSCVGTPNVPSESEAPAQSVSSEESTDIEVTLPQTETELQTETVFVPEEVVTTTAPPEDPAQFPYEITDIDELRKWAGTKSIVQHAVGLIAGDTDALFGYYADKFDEKTASEVKSLKISDFRFVFENEEDFNYSKALFEFTVAESEWGTFPPGEYSYILRNGPVIRMENNTPDEIQVPDKFGFPKAIVDSISPYCFAMENAKCLDGDERGWFDYGFFVTIWQAERMLGNESHSLSKWQMSEYAKALFDLDGYVPPDHVGITSPYDDHISIAGRGADVVFEKFVGVRETENGVVLVKQLYAESLCLVPSHRVEYVFEKNTSRYGWTLKEIVCVERSRYEPGGFAV